MELKNKVAIVTGGRGIIGSAICQRLKNSGCEVIATYCNPKRGYWTPDTLSRYLDLGFSESVKHFGNFVSDMGGLDILINNAGINIPNDFECISESDWNKVMDINLKGVFLLTQILLPMIKEGGSIVNVGSLSGFIGGPRTTHYAVSKMGLVALTQNIALTAAKRNIRCNLVSPGYIDSPMTAEGSENEAVKKVVDSIPLGRLGLPAEVANAIAFLASDESSYITGQVLHVNGGVYW